MILTRNSRTSSFRPHRESSSRSEAPRSKNLLKVGHNPLDPLVVVQVGFDHCRQCQQSSSQHTDVQANSFHLCPNSFREERNNRVPKLRTRVRKRSPVECPLTSPRISQFPTYRLPLFLGSPSIPPNRHLWRYPLQQPPFG
jgi:hypothetical protein